MGVEAEQLHLDIVGCVEFQLTRREGRGVLAPGADRRELDDDPLIALHERVDQQLVRAGLELEMLEGIDVERDREGREVGRGLRRVGDDALDPAGPVRDDVAMTGEITLRGNVLPIGGVKEKLLAARRAKIKTVILPAPNERDLEDLPQEVLDDLNFVFVDHVSQVFAAALLEPKPAARSASVSPVSSALTRM